tara:strand:- start:2769 stop:3512 length:744 start_codon:yes stop_codon:yes gene_type:complete
MIRMTEPFFIPSKHKYGLSTSPIWDFMNRNVTFAVRCNPEWDKIKEGQDIGLVVRNGMHAGLQLSHEYIPVLECNKGFVKGLIWIKESEDEPAKPKMLIHGLGPIHEEETWDIVWSHDVKRKQVSLMVAKQGWEKPHVETMIYNGTLVDYSQSWLWIGCNNALEMVPETDKGFYVGDIGRVGIFGSIFKQEDYIEYFTKDEFDLDYWKYKNPIARIDFKSRTPYKFWDSTLNGNNATLYRPEWGDLF